MHDSLELLKADLIILIQYIRLLYYIFYFSLTELSVNPLESLFQVRPRDEVAIVDVKVFEGLSQVLFIQYFFAIQCRGYEFRVIYFPIPNVISLLNHLLYFLISDGHSCSLHGFLELVE